jgi:Xaa-Pro aminopeptidase
LDFGVRIGTLHSDISRTIPVNGKFNPLQALLYQIVLDASAEYQKYVRPGVSLREIGHIPWDFIMDALDTRLKRGHAGKFKLLYDRRPHGVSHFIGEQIHEGNPGSRSLDTVLKPGMLISCEPGLYGEFSGIFNGKRVSGKIGIRIEDDLLITAKGFRNISFTIPREIEELERIMRA